MDGGDQLVRCSNCSHEPTDERGADALCNDPPDSVQPLPRFVVVSLRYLEFALSQSCSMPCGRRFSRVPLLSVWTPSQMRRERASAVGCRTNPRMVHLTRRALTGHGRCGPVGDAKKRTASLQGLAIVYGVKLLTDPTDISYLHSLTILPATTDNRGNGFALTKLYSSKHPSCCIMELTKETRRRRMVPSVSWGPREMNDEADRLSRGDTRGFSAGLRRGSSLGDVSCHILRQALDCSEELADRIAEKRERRRAGRFTKPERRKCRPKERLRVRDPWDAAQV